MTGTQKAFEGSAARDLAGLHGWTLCSCIEYRRARDARAWRPKLSLAISAAHGLPWRSRVDAGILGTVAGLGHAASSGRAGGCWRERRPSSNSLRPAGSFGSSGHLRVALD